MSGSMRIVPPAISGGDPAADHGTALPGRWPQHDVLELAALPTAVPCARLHARQVLWEWRQGPVGEDAALVVSELVSNAVAASGPGATVRLWLLCDGPRVLIVVQDTDPRPPQVRAPGPEADSGRGLVLVAAVTARWGWHPGPAAGGKSVWAELRAAPGAPG